MPYRYGPRTWIDTHCPSLEGQFLFLNPLSWETHQLNEGAAVVLREAAAAIEQGRFSAFLAEVDEAGGWPPELESLARSLDSLASPDGFLPVE